MKRLIGLLLASSLVGAGCGSGRGPVELEPLAHGARAPAALPDEAERRAAGVARLVLAGREDEAEARLAELRRDEAERGARGLAPTGLVDNASELLAAARGEEAYREFAREQLDRGEHDPALRRRLEVYLESWPLARAERRLSEHRRRRVGEVFNRVTVPVSRAALAGSVYPIETGRAALAALLVTHSFPPISTQERQALRAYKDFLERYPDAPEAEWVREQVERYGEELTRARQLEAVEFAQRALAAGQPVAAGAHLERAKRIAPLGAAELELERRIEALQARRDEDLRSSFAVAPPPPPADPHGQLARLHEAAVAAPPDVVATRARGLRHARERGLEDEVDFLAALESRASAREDEFFNAMRQIAELDPGSHNMARHARYVLADPRQNPYDVFRRARSADRRARSSWLALGRRGKGALRRGIPRPLEWLLDLPGFVVSLATAPVRLFQYPSARGRFGGAVIEAGERYAGRFPDGDHIEEVHGELEDLYATRQMWSKALEHHRARASRDEDTIARYRSLIAERRLQAAALHPRLDVRASLYRSIVLDYEGTPAAQEALRAFQTLIENATPQDIRISREFLEEHPILWRPDALGLRPELFDDEPSNGELAAEGVTLVGQSAVRIRLEGREPLTRSVPPEHFARFVALLEEESYRELVTDARERPQIDPQRDLFFERARMGLLDEPDMRPAAASRAVFLGSSEKHGAVRRRASLLPVELVLQGGLEDLVLGAFPRVVLPPETPDAFLYR